MKKLILLLMAISTFGAGCSSRGCSAKTDLPELDFSRPLILRTVRVVNPRLPALSEDEYRRTIETARDAFRRYFGVEISFDDRGTMTIEQFFAKYFEPFAGQNPGARFILPAEAKSIDALKIALMIDYKDDFLDDLKKSAAGLAEEQRLTATSSRESFFTEVGRIHVKKLMEMQAIELADGRSLLDGEFNQYVNWAWLSAKQSDFDFIFTNQLLASAEGRDTAIHASLRGGVSTGVVNPSPTPYGGVSIMSSAPFILPQDFFERERGYPSSASETPELIGTYTTHELGHLIMRYGHPTGPGAEYCIMRPAVGLNYRQWRDRIAQEKCNSEMPKLTSFE